VERIRKQESRRSVLEAVIAYTQEVLGTARGEIARQYLTKERGFTETEIRSLNLGFYPLVSEIHSFLKAKEYDFEEAKEVGILWEKLKGYILIPWADDYGRPLTIYGRWHTKNPPEGLPKTIALPGEGTKASPLYFDRARRAGHKDLVLVEGAFDAGLLQVRGDTRVIACLAAQLSRKQAETLARHKIQSVTICLDPDSAGDKGILSCIKTLEQVRITAYVAPRLPSGMDPDEFVLQFGIEKWKEHVAQAAHAYRYIAQDIIKRNKPGEEWTDKGHSVALEEAISFAVSKSDEQQVKIETYFWPEIYKQTGTSQKAVQKRIAADKEKAASNKSEQVSLKATARSQAQLLGELASDAELFCTPDGTAYATFPVEGHRETWSINSRGSSGFRQWLRHRFYQLEGKPPHAHALQDALEVLEAKAQFDGQKLPVYVRLAQHEGAIYLDLANKKWEVIEITASGWKVVANPPVRFRRPKGTLPLPVPVKGGSLEELRAFLNIKDEESWCLLVAWLVAAFRPVGPYTILVLQGEQGTAKSTTARMLRALIDPITAPLRRPPREDRDLMIAAHNSWIVGFDNLSGVVTWLSDTLCALATGSGFATRELYTNMEEVLFDAQRPLIINGIEDLTTRQDLADRSIILNLPPIEENRRCNEQDLWRKFEEARPRILGSLLDVISIALRELPNTHLNAVPRMADFAYWVTAAEAALPWPKGRFLEAYRQNRAQSIELSLETDPVATAIRSLMEETKEWKGTASGLLEALGRYIPERIQRSNEWPKSVQWLSNRLKRLATNLRGANIEVGFDRESGTGRRLIVIRSLSSK
jgi:DNA primase